MTEISKNAAEPVAAGAWNPERRAFIKVAIGGVCLAYAAAIGYPVYRYLNSPVEAAASLQNISGVRLKGAEKLEPGSVLLFKFGADPAMLIHHKTGEWVAFNAVCTHLGCTVEFDKPLQQIVCHCHGGVYDARTGANISGPPPGPLTKLQVHVGDDLVVVSKA